MAHVLVLDSTSEDTFFCGSCKVVFNSLTLFLAHKNNQCKKQSHDNAEEPTKSISEYQPLSACSEQILTQIELNENLSPKINKDKCKKENTVDLDSHPKMHEKPHQCVICGRCFIQNSHLQSHVLTHKVWPDGISETTAKTTGEDLLSYSCMYCDSTLPTYSQYRIHLKKHMCLKKYKCIQNQCNCFYDTVESLMHHVSSAHKTVTYRCHKCNNAFDSLKEIAFHYESNDYKCNNPPSPTELFKCSQCDAMFTKAEKLSLHMLTENHNKVCIHCNKTFSSDKRLRLHLQVHRKLKPFKCTICSQSFRMKKYLTTHLLKHGEKNYECKVCKGLFKRKDSLNRHMNTHQQRKMYKCPFTDTFNCKKEFSRSDKLKSHIKFHTNKITGHNNQKAQCAADSVEICIVPLDNKNKE